MNSSAPRFPTIIMAVLVLGIALLAFAAVLAVGRARFLASSEHATGTVFSVSNETMRDLNGRILGNGRRISARFFDQAGQSFTVRSSVTSSITVARVGDAVEINYPAGRPDRAVIGTFVDRWLLPLILGFIGGVAILIGGLGAWIAKQPGTQIYVDGRRRFGIATRQVSVGTATVDSKDTTLFNRETGMLPGGFSRSVWIILGLIVAAALGFFIARSTQDGRTSQASVEQVVGNASTPAPAPTPAQTSAGGNWPSNLTVQVPPTSSPAAAALPTPANDPGFSTQNGPALTQMARAFLARPEQDRAMQAALRAKAARLPGLCSALSFVPGDTLVARTPFPMFDAAGVMRRGLIRQRFTGAGCPDAAPRFNIWVFAADPANPIKTVAGYMGATRADPPLQRDATPIALTIAARLAPGCDTMSVIDTRLPRGASTPPAPGPWAEEWLIAACGRYVQLTMHFVPEANGTTRIEVPSSEAKLINAS